jgi:hypothetical protein
MSLAASVIIRSTDNIAFFKIGPSTSGRLQIFIQLEQLYAKEIDGNQHRYSGF